MIRIKNYIVSILILSGLILYAGCSASSSSIRYSEKEDETSKTPSIRYSEEDGDLPDEKPIDITPLVNSNSSLGSSPLKEKVLMEVIKYLNTPYKYGGNSKAGIDCSAFTQTIYNKCLSIPIQRTAKGQYSEGVPVQAIDELEFCDLVFFDTGRNVKPGHVGIYLGDDLFAHASSKGVTVSSFDSDYYSSRFIGGRRIENFLGSK